MTDQDLPINPYTPPNHSDDSSPPSDSHDTTYSEPPLVHKLWITPKQRKGQLEDFSEAAKKRVQKATSDLTKLRCIVSNTPELYSVTYAHILPRATHPQIIERLEYSWGMSFETLHVDSRFNVLRRERSQLCWIYYHRLMKSFEFCSVNVAQHSEFDRARWLLLPEERIIKIYLNHEKRPIRNFKDLVDEGTYKYRYIPAASLHAAEIRRYSKAMSPTDQAGPDDFESFYYPYLDLPTITSHVHPHFVICNIGLKMQNSSNLLEFLGQNSLLSPNDKYLIEDAVKIYRNWIAAIPPEANFHRERYLEPPAGDDNSDVTRVGRLGNQGVRRSTRAHPNGHLEMPSDRRSLKRSRREQDSNLVSLDGETLRALDEDAYPGKKLRLKRDSVAAWISSISGVKFDALTASAEYIPG